MSLSLNKRPLSHLKIPVFTIGKSGLKSNVLLPVELLSQNPHYVIYLQIYMYSQNVHVLSYWLMIESLQRPKIYKRFHILRISPLVYIWDWVHVYETGVGVRRSRLNDIFCKKYLRTQFLFEVYKIFMIPTSNSFLLKWCYSLSIHSTSNSNDNQVFYLDKARVDFPIGIRSKSLR